MVIRDVLIWGSNMLKQNGIDSLDARILLKAVTGFDDIGLSVNSNMEVPSDINDKYTVMINRRIKNEPVAYITGTKELHATKQERS